MQDVMGPLLVIFAVRWMLWIGLSVLVGMLAVR